ncbi:hypothetical protein ERD95_19655 [Enterobacteriaceae bacterium ML5]|nr:hypothetical protein ERD95_19655 [Enterobacteriaceae bacterium ML5]
MKYSDGAKMFIAGVAGAGLICVVILFQLLSGSNRVSSHLYRLPQGSLTCDGEAKVVDKQQLIQDLSEMGPTGVCVENIGENDWKVRSAKQHLAGN